MSRYMRSMKGLIDAVDHVGKNFISINDMSNEQLLNLFELGKELELSSHYIKKVGRRR